MNFYKLVLFSLNALLIFGQVVSDSEDCKKVVNFFSQYPGFPLPVCCEEKKSPHILCENGSITRMYILLF